MSNLPERYQYELNRKEQELSRLHLKVTEQQLYLAQMDFHWKKWLESEKTFARRSSLDAILLLTCLLYRAGLWQEFSLLGLKFRIPSLDTQVGMYGLWFFSILSLGVSIDIMANWALLQRHRVPEAMEPDIHNNRWGKVDKVGNPVKNRTIDFLIVGRWLQVAFLTIMLILIIMCLCFMASGFWLLKKPPVSIILNAGQSHPPSPGVPSPVQNSVSNLRKRTP